MQAKRLNPKIPEPIIHDGLVYKAVHKIISDDGKSFQAYISVSKEATGEPVRTILVYEIPYIENLEQDIQSRFITDVEIKDGKLVVHREGGSMDYSFDL